jgi:oxygen-dependent protoporphyrinogen oxidase
VRRIPRATPIYAVGHGARVARLAEHARALGAFALAGNAHAGVGVPDCVASGEAAARAVLAALPAV